MKKYCIFLLYWIMNIIRIIIVFPIYIFKCLIIFIAWVVANSFSFNLYKPNQTYSTFKDVIDDMESGEDLYLIIFSCIILPGFIVSIPVFILRQIYCTWKFIEEEYLKVD